MNERGERVVFHRASLPVVAPPGRARRRRTAGFFSVALLTLLPGFARAEDLKAKPVTVPFELLKTQHMTIQVKVNGKGPYRLIFDTGAPVNLINNKVAKEADVFPKDFKRPPFAFFGSMGQFTIQTLEIGDLKVEKVKTMVMDHPTVTAISNALGPIEGIVGMSFFGRYRMTLDYQARTMTFVPTDFQPQDMMENLMKIVLSGQVKERKVLAPGGLVGIKVAKEKDDSEPGVVIQAVFAGSPAADAGLKVGDRLLTLNHRWTDSVADCYAAAATMTPGSAARVQLRRDGKEMELTIAARPGL
jgi:predicted aspartyl protease